MLATMMFCYVEYTEGSPVCAIIRKPMAYALCSFEWKACTAHKDASHLMTCLHKVLQINKIVLEING